MWQRPFIRLDAKTWFVPMPHLFFSFCWELLGDLLKAENESFARYSRRRAEYLEQAVAQAFESAFPMATVLRGNYWTDPASGIEYENDILIRVDAFVFIIEAKSGISHASARRGAPNRLEQVIEDLYVAPARQCQRLEAFIRNQKGTVTLRGRSGQDREFDLRGVRHVISYVLTLDHACDLGAVHSELHQTGWIPDDLVLPPLMSLSDLQNIFEILEGYCPKIHYLIRRAQVHRHAKYFGDELDLLATYLDCQLDLGEAEFDDTGIFGYGVSPMLDDYFLSKEAGGAPRRPRLKITRWWQNILRALDKRLPTMWSLIGAELLNVPVSDQGRFGELMKDLRESVLAGQKETADRVLMVAGPQSRPVAIAGVCYVDDSREGRDKRLRDAAGQVRFPDGGQPERVVVLGCDPRIQRIPYSVLLYAEFGEKSGTILEL